MSVATYTKTGGKSSSAASLDKQVFSVAVADHQLLKSVYGAAKSNARVNVAHTKTRGEIRGGGRKPWRQKGTGRARFGSTRNPIWRGGGIVFGPRATVNHNQSPNLKARRLALRQALSLANTGQRLAVIEAVPSTGKTAELAKLLSKINFIQGLLVLGEINPKLKRAANNLPNVRVVAAQKLAAADVLDAPSLLLDKPALAVLGQRLKG